MEKKSLWMLVLVFVVGIIFGSLAGNTNQLTGGGAKGLKSLGLGNPDAPDTSILTLEPLIVARGENLKITVIPGKDGIDSRDGNVGIYHVNDIGLLGAKIYRLWLCESQTETCYDPGTVEFTIPNSWSPGPYAAVVKERRSEEDVRVDFTVQ